MKTNKISLKTRVINHVESLNRPATWTELHDFLIMFKIAEGVIDPMNYMNNKRRYRGWYSSYFNESTGYNDWVPKGRMLVPSKTEPRYLVKNSDGLYVVAA